MTTPAGAGDFGRLQAAVAALAAQVERQARQLAEQRAVTERAQESADQAHRVLVDIVDRVKEIADRPAPAGPETAAPVSWLTIEDHAAAHAALSNLVDWLQRVYVHYPGAADSLGECWPWHPTAVEELLALRAAWHAAYTNPDATPARAIDWHDRHLSGVTRRLRATLCDCSIAAHRPGGRADHTRPRVPAVDAAGEIAEWWTTTHGTTAAPPPAEPIAP
jgi:hypothetical protein